jgi:galactokinase
MTGSVIGRFRDLTGSAAEGCWMAPGRINLIGDHTDYNEGFALPFALDLNTHVAAALRPDRQLTIRSLQRPGEVISLPIDELRPGMPEDWPSYAAGVVWVLREEGYSTSGLDFLVNSEIPLGAGFSSSAALTCGVALACSDLLSISLTPSELIALAQRAESEFSGVPVGRMDQTASLLCCSSHALLFDARHDAEQIPFDPPASGLALLAIDTRVPHRLQRAGYAERRRECEVAARLLKVKALRDITPTELDSALGQLEDRTLQKRVRHVVRENSRVLETIAMLRAGRVSDIGMQLSASHFSLRDDFAVSCRELDVVVEAAIEAGALGARMTGAGFGGAAIALLAAEDVDRVSSHIRSASKRQGMSCPRSFPVMPAGGARRVC